MDRFNAKWAEYKPVPPYTEDDLNKLCFQNATGSDKTLIMHVNLLQYQHYARQAGRENDLSRVILLTPDERLSEQHLGDLAQSDIKAEWYVGGRQTLFTQEAKGLQRVDVLEIVESPFRPSGRQDSLTKLGSNHGERVTDLSRTSTYLRPTIPQRLKLVRSGEPDERERTSEVALVNREPRGESLGLFAFLAQISGVLG